MAAPGSAFGPFAVAAGLLSSLLLGLAFPFVPLALRLPLALVALVVLFSLTLVPFGCFFSVGHQYVPSLVGSTLRQPYRRIRVGTRVGSETGTRRW